MIFRLAINQKMVYDAYNQVACFYAGVLKILQKVNNVSSKQSLR